MRKAIVDTDTLSEVLKGVNPRIMANAAAYVSEHTTLTFTSVTLYEIVTGLEHNQAHAKLNRALEHLKQNDEIVPESEDYLLAAQILGTLRRKGREIGYSDPLVAACGIRRNCPIVTGNQKHFGFIQDAGFELRLRNWRVE